MASKEDSGLPGSSEEQRAHALQTGGGQESKFVHTGQAQRHVPSNAVYYPLTGIVRAAGGGSGGQVLLWLHHLPRLQLIQRPAHLLQLPPRPSLDAVPPAQRRAGAGQVRSGQQVRGEVGSKRRSARAEAGKAMAPTMSKTRSSSFVQAANSQAAANHPASQPAHLQARLRVVGQMPRRLAASFSPTPN